MPGLPRPIISFTPRNPSAYRLPLPLLLLLSLCISSRSSALSLDLALLRNFGLSRCRRSSSRSLIRSRLLFANRGNVSHGQALIREELERTGMRQVGDVDRTIDLEPGNIDVQMARNVRRKALNFDLAQNMLQDAALVLHAGRNADQLNWHGGSHRLIHSNAL